MGVLVALLVIGNWGVLKELSSFHQGLTILLYQNPQAEVYVAAYEFRPEEEGELYFKRGDLIEVIDKEDSNWWKGKNVSSGNLGLFPATYVQKKANN